MLGFLWIEFVVINERELFGRHYGELKKCVVLAISAKVINFEAGAKMNFDDDSEQPDNNLLVMMGETRFHCKMDWAVREWISQGTVDDLKHISFVLLGSAEVKRGAAAAMGLVLHPSTRQEFRDTFVRIGIFHIEPEEGGLAKFKSANREMICIV